MICGIVSYSVFFIFSLIGNLAENLSFKNILLLSSLNSLQIFTYIPSHLYILSISLFIISLKSKNELMIVKEYLQLKKLFIIVLPFLSVFIFIESNKNYASEGIEKIKSNLIHSKNSLNTKIFINTNEDKKTYKVVRKDFDDSLIANQYLEYQIQNQSIQSGVFSNELFVIENDLFGSNSIIYRENEFINNNLEKKIFTNFSSFWTEKSKVIKKDELKTNKSILISVYSVFFNILFYLCISMFFLSKKLVSRNIHLLKNFIIIISLFLYFLVFPKINLENFQLTFKLISIFIFSLIFLK